MVKDPILLIFDIDGTLTDSAGLTRIALEMAALDLYGVERTTNGIAAWGQTDLNIFQLMVTNNSLPIIDVPYEFKSFSKRYTTRLEEILFQSDKPRLHNGIRELLEHIVGEPDLYLALGTGNIEATGYMKLRRHKIDHLFPVGGFGSDSSDRSALLKIALERARTHYRQTFPVGSYWVIGDTPNDILSGKRIAAETVAVCTGAYKPDELVRHRPTAVLPDLSNVDYVMALIRREIKPADGQATLFEQEVTGEESDPL